MKNKLIRTTGTPDLETKRFQDDVTAAAVAAAVTAASAAILPLVPQHSMAYSTTEHVVGTWYDGRPLYAKTIHKDYSELTDYGVRKGFTLDATYDRIVNVEACSYLGSYGYIFLGCNNYIVNTAAADHISLNMYYQYVVLEFKGTAYWSEYQPDLTVTFYYVKSTT